MTITHKINVFLLNSSPKLTGILRNLRIRLRDFTRLGRLSLIHALKWNPENIYANYKNDADTALDYYKQILALKPNDQLALNNIGVKLMEAGKLDQAQQYLDQLTIYHLITDDSQPGQGLDKWDYWVFDINADTDLEGEESEKELSLRGRISAERITPNWKFEFEVEQDYDRQTFRDDGSSIFEFTVDFLSICQANTH